MAIESSMRNSLNPRDNSFGGVGAVWAERSVGGGSAGGSPGGSAGRSAGDSEEPFFSRGFKAVSTRRLETMLLDQPYVADKGDATCFTGVPGAPLRVVIAGTSRLNNQKEEKQYKTFHFPTPIGRGLTVGLWGASRVAAKRPNERLVRRHFPGNPFRFPT